MRVTYECLPTDHADACRQLEAACEGIVVAMFEEIDQWPEGTFPCCIKCGGFCLRSTPITPAEAQAIQITLAQGDLEVDERADLEGIMTGSGYFMPEDIAVVPAAPSPNPQRNQESWAYEACVPERYRQTAAPLPAATVQVRCAREILRTKTGSTIELACYQCAQKRRHADPCAKVKIVCTGAGTFRAVVLCSQQHEKPERRGIIDDPVEDAKPQGSCGCGIEEHEEEA
jgi:hypothetical protein